MSKFSLKWLLVAVGVVALLCGWLVDRSRLARELATERGYVVERGRLLELLSAETERRNEAEALRDGYQAQAFALEQKLYGRMHADPDGWLILDGYGLSPESALELCNMTWVRAVEFRGPVTPQVKSVLEMHFEAEKNGIYFRGSRKSTPRRQ